MSGVGVRVSGHFGELLQGRLGKDGPIALISLPCPALALQAWHLPGAGLTVHGAGQQLLSPERARRLLGHLRLRLGGRVILRAAMPAGGGAGASTAALVALARLAQPDLCPKALARACVLTEGASDPLMMATPERLLWASRQGHAIEVLPPLPGFDVLGGFYGPPQRTDPADKDFPDIADLVADWRRLTTLTALAGLATESARRTLARRSLSADDPTERLARDFGALGVTIAHTGSARGLLFPPGGIPADGAARLIRAGFRGVLRFRCGVGQ